ncbi:Pleiotropic drug resistance protein 1 [Hibiscus syriacus]|uniref:Pleiotropic drug resistance protein 1 n=1 Tax=Hibiscus syriacus TaxID=106335 RepID=A0A6A2X6I5_HIBSY|nr:Pleiotropic drug resistance protein 1 [Hibiscus syriacus]
MVLPFEPHSMTFDGIIYSVDMPQFVSGAFRPGVLTALMGVSGVGKTTLMDVLAGRKTGGYIDGNTTVSCFPKKHETFARMFIEEIMDLVDLVELNPLRQALVGLPGINGLSTEQRKRLTIAVKLVANPSIIFMDEPTSGLDARAAAIVMRTVRNTVDTGRTVVSVPREAGRTRDICRTIRTPFETSDQVLRGIQGVSKIKDGYNPATWMLEVTTTAQELSLGVDFTDIYKNSDLYMRNKALIEDLSKPAPGTKELYFPTQYSQSFMTQCAACLWKHTGHIGATHHTLLFGFFLRLQELTNAMGSIYAAVLFLGVQNASSVQPVVAVERTVFYRERATGMYSAMPCAISQVLIKLPYIFVQATVYGLIVYSMIRFKWTAAKFFCIRVWWRWYYWICPVSWTFYGLVVSQFGDLKTPLVDGEFPGQMVEEYFRSYYDFRHDFLGVVVAGLSHNLTNFTAAASACRYWKLKKKLEKRSC